MDLQQQLMTVDVAKPFLHSFHKDQSWATSATSLLVCVLEDDAKSFKLHVDASLTACADACKCNTVEQIQVNLSSKSQKGNNY